MEDANTKKRYSFSSCELLKIQSFRIHSIRIPQLKKKLYEMEQEKKSLKQREARFLSDVFAAVAVVVA